MCDKACDGGCYPTMQTAYAWRTLKSTEKTSGHYVTLKDGSFWKLHCGKFKKGLYHATLEK